MTDMIRNPKYALRKSDERPAKAHKHRYERRRVREMIKTGNWVEDTTP